MKITFSTSKHKIKAAPRRGISILEVLFSIGIATIGLFGVLALIPFAVHQANVGLNIERGMTTGRNAIAEFEIRGYHDPAYWHFEDIDPNSGNQFVVPYDPRDSFVIDPEYIAHYGNIAGQFPAATGRGLFPCVEDHINFASSFPDLFPPGSGVDAGATDFRPFIYRGTIEKNGALMSKGMSKQVVRNIDDIVYKFRENASTLEDEFVPPKGEFVQIDDGTGSLFPAKRQTLGEFSWMAFVRPEKSGFDSAPFATRQYSIDIAVMHERYGFGDDISPALGIENDDAFDRVFLVNPASFVNNLLIAGGEIELSQECRSVNSTRNQHWLEIKDGDWIVLTNKTYGFRWFQVSNVEDLGNNDNVDPVAGTWRMTIQGPTFSQGLNDTTYAIHVPGVVNVFSKTFLVEPSSSWK